ncbi:MAG: ATP-binding cassette domain-containing protein [Bacteroidales bacterium]|jgi:phospholipid/cholesterol/gamma-HCH transport system ATP-binding protein|nr:ATP-binding cassette domain-containing protein [Bacteroidales bacterium]MDD3810773.1 ATP-binding cassette domain-containing protein [Bacteroidales bacterium]
MIRLESISKSFEGNPAIAEVSASFQQGKPNLIIGRSGSGKTVLMKCIIGLLTPDSGEIFYENRALSSLNITQRSALRQEMGVVFQGGALFDSLTVEQNLKLPMEFFTDWSRSEKTRRANFCLERVNLPGVNKLYPAELSGGMKKRVAIARSIVLNPKYLFCDEPNSGLDPQTAILIDNLLLELTREFNMTTIINTHDLNSVMEIGEKILFLSKGRRCWEGTREEILVSDNQTLNNFVFASQLMKKIK